ncbi:MAG: methyltransferase [Candidatus Magnetoglobus multicellularis str. Araruama]|uniref:Release factor glutamine methyltransferase n=1 Tax=Candidatus Magnetoglobus multicellularis str. Araruama TaxID=890399 RepID=A0A1V1P7G0_9BACT|nr:MAG: methyltransferase [Candidatus Magnetoglobus multicellularis str. Araruama]
MNTEQWTIKSVLDWTLSYFTEKCVESPRLSAEILLASTLGLERIDLYVQYDRPLDKQELAAFKAKILRRTKHEPVAYITEKKAFWKSTFIVTPHVLIPRPDTESLLETAIAHLNSKQKGLRILELGIGSGAIIVSLARELPYHTYFGTDCSSAAIDIARQNATQMDVRIHFVVSHWLDALSKTFDLIISNPPYIPTLELQSLSAEIVQFEPQVALDGGNDGLFHIRTIIQNAPQYLASDGVLMLEMGCDQGKAIQELIAEERRSKTLQILKDYAGHERVVCIGNIGQS